MELLENPLEGMCSNCDTVQVFIQNPKILAEMKHLHVVNQGLMEELLLNQSKIDRLGRMLNPVEVVKQPRWKRSLEVHTCSKCGRNTRFIYGELPRCYQECKPAVIRGKVGIEDIPDAIQQLIRDTLGMNDDEDLGDIEFIRRV